MVNDISKGQTRRTSGSIDCFTPAPDSIYSSVCVLGRGTHTIRSGRSLRVLQKVAAAGEDPDLETAYDNCTGIAKAYRPEGPQGNETDIPQKAEQDGEKTSFINSNCKQPPSSTCPIMNIRESMGPDPPGSRISCCFICRSRPWKAGIYHGETNTVNLTDNPLSKKGNPNDFDPAQFASQGVPREQANIGALPFIAMPLLSFGASYGKISRKYHHEAEAFAWVLIYICGTASEHKGKIINVDPNPFKCWFRGSVCCLDNKLNLLYTIRRLKLPVHDHARPLLVGLCNLWGGDGERDAVAPEFAFDGIEDGDESPLGWHKESSDLRTFADVVAVFGKTLRANGPEYNYAVELVKRFKEFGIDSVQ